MIQINKILIEHWPLLQCVNVFISFTENLSNITDSINVTVQKNKVQLKYDQNFTTIELSQWFQFKLHSLSLLIIEQNYLSFRLNTNTDNNNFELEYIDCSNSLTNNKLTQPMTLLTIKPNESFLLCCSNCTCQLSETLQFKRILELPSQNIDINEWFCHKPHHQITSNVVDVNDNIDKMCTKTMQFNANANDLLYGNFFVVINDVDKFKNIISQSNTIYCKRCLKYIGEKHQNLSLKIWNENVTINRINNNLDNHLFSESKSIFGNFMFIIRKMLQDFNFSADVGMPPINKILFEGDSLNGQHRRYLLLHILKRNLDVYVSFNNTNECLESIILEKINAMKIQFCVIDKNQNNNEQHHQRSYALLKFWQNDATVVQFEISRQMLDVSIKNLYKNADFVGECRHSNDGFMLSYLF